jgi:hypothetical protein
VVDPQKAAATATEHINMTHHLDTTVPKPTSKRTRLREAFQSVAASKTDGGLQHRRSHSLDSFATVVTAAVTEAIAEGFRPRTKKADSDGDEGQKKSPPATEKDPKLGKPEEKQKNPKSGGPPKPVGEKGGASKTPSKQQMGPKGKGKLAEYDDKGKGKQQHGEEVLTVTLSMTTASRLVEQLQDDMELYGLLHAFEAKTAKENEVKKEGKQAPSSPKDVATKGLYIYLIFNKNNI